MDGQQEDQSRLGFAYVYWIGDNLFDDAKNGKSLLIPSRISSSSCLEGPSGLTRNEILLYSHVELLSDVILTFSSR